MAVPTVTLTGDAVTGILPDLTPRAYRAELPATVCLGRNRPKARPQAMSLGDLVKKFKELPSIPASCDWYTKAQPSIARMYLNDRYGDCVFASKAHMLGGWSANDPDSSPSGVVLATDKEISDQYFAYTGGRDDGAIISEVLDIMKSPGFLAGGTRYTIDGYVSCDWRSKELTQVGLQLFGPGCIGIDLPSAWTSAAVWDVTNTRSVGGHDVAPFGYGKVAAVSATAEGVVISSWGRLYIITWAAWQSTNWLEELYFCVPTFLWTGADRKTPLGINMEELKADLKQIGGGNLPPLPEPGPTPPGPGPGPTPPQPTPPSQWPTYAISLAGDFPKGGLFGGTQRVTISGTAIPSPTRSVLGWDWTNINWWALLSDGAQLFVHFQNKDWNAVAQDVQRIIADLGIFGGALRVGSVNWWAVMTDLLRLFADYQMKNLPGMIADVQQLLKDLGISLPFQPHAWAANVQLGPEEAEGIKVN